MKHGNKEEPHVGRVRVVPHSEQAGATTRCACSRAASRQNPSDEKLKKALTALQNDKRLKMSPWEPMWWQLGLETPAMQQPQFAGAGRRRGFR